MPSQKPNEPPSTALARIAALLELNRIERLASQAQQDGRAPRPEKLQGTTAERRTA